MNHTYHCQNHNFNITNYIYKRSVKQSGEKISNLQNVDFDLLTNDASHASIKDFLLIGFFLLGTHLILALLLMTIAKGIY